MYMLHSSTAYLVGLFLHSLCSKTRLFLIELVSNNIVYRHFAVAREDNISLHGRRDWALQGLFGLVGHRYERERGKWRCILSYLVLHTCLCICLHNPIFGTPDRLPTDLENYLNLAGIT